MGRLIWLLALAALASTSSAASAESVYLTSSDRIEEYGLGEGYTFIAPYFTRVETTLWISITKAASTSSQNSNNSDNSQSPSKPATASIYYAAWQQTQAGAATGQIRYAVSCDLSSVLKQGDAISVSGIEPADIYSGNKIVANVTPDSIFVNTDVTRPKPTTAPVSGTLNASCPPAAAAPSFGVTFGVTTTPKNRAYLYWLRNAFFSDSVNVGLDSNGMLSSSDSSSTQQITSILTELAQTVGQFAFAGGRLAFELKSKPVDPRSKCFTAIANLLKSGPYFVNYRYGTAWPRPADFDPDVKLDFRLQPLAQPTGQQSFDRVVEVSDFNGRTKVIGWRNGLLAFYPVPAKATLACIVTTPGSSKADTVFLSAPSIINLYTASQFVDPQRDFLTGPQDTFTFNAGFIVGHKYGDQSSAKTIVDTVTAPIRALIPSVSIQQNTQVQTGGGKPDQTTTSTQTTTGPPKTQ
ncbi:MAG: hypothetical protein J2P55_06120 [Rhizobiales bacterium]|nr:hypothetical protein [Hyphomicrobiales bacterium]